MVAAVKTLPTQERLHDGVSTRNEHFTGKTQLLYQPHEDSAGKTLGWATQPHALYILTHSHV